MTMTANEMKYFKTQAEYFAQGLIDAARWYPDGQLTHVEAWAQFEDDGTLTGIADDASRCGFDYQAASVGYVEGSVLAVNSGLLARGHYIVGETIWSNKGKDDAVSYHSSGGKEVALWSVAARAMSENASIEAEDLAAYVLGWNESALAFLLAR